MIKNAFLFLLAAIVLSGCSGIKVVSDFDPTVDFTQYKTFEYYGWLEESDKLLNDLDKRRIESAFGAEFEARGLKYVEEGGDIVVGLFIVAQQKTQTTATTTSMGGYGGGYGGYYGYGPGWGWGGGHSTTTYSEYDYVEGTLVCDIYDKTKEQLVWEGIGTATIKENPKNREESIPAAVKKIMAEYPVAPITE
jgi:ABC-type glycerol-3-phosphate transport system substrate-binding protein